MAIRPKRQTWIAWIGVTVLAVVVVGVALLVENNFNFKIEASTTGIEKAANELTDVETINVKPSTNATTTTPTTNTNNQSNTNTSTTTPASTIKLIYKLKFSDCSSSQPALNNSSFKVVIDNKSYLGQLSGNTLTITTDLTTAPELLSFTITGYEPVSLSRPLSSNGQTITLSKINGQKGLCTDASGNQRLDNLTLTINLSVADCPDDYIMSTNDLIIKPAGVQTYYDELSSILYIPIASIPANNSQVEIFYQGYYGKVTIDQTGNSIVKNLTLKQQESALKIQCGNSSDDLTSYEGITEAIAKQENSIKNSIKKIQKLQTSSSLLSGIGLSGNSSVLISTAQLELNQQVSRLQYLQELANAYDLPDSYSQYTDPTQLISNAYNSIYDALNSGYSNYNNYNPYTQTYTYDSSNPEMYSYSNNYSYLPSSLNNYSYNTLVSPYQSVSAKCILAPTITSKVGELLENIPTVGSILSTVSNIFGLSYAYKNCSGYAAYNYSTLSDNDRYYPYNNNYYPYSSVTNTGSTASILISGPYGNLQTSLGNLPLGSTQLNSIWRWYVDTKTGGQYNYSDPYTCPYSTSVIDCNSSTNMDSNRRAYCNWAIQNCPASYISY